jgi:hypothetical protein
VIGSLGSLDGKNSPLARKILLSDFLFIFFLSGQQEWAPVRSAAPTLHLAPPDIPAADGTEVRFTTIANSMGIHWKDVPEEEKRSVYIRAADLHELTYGRRPPRVMMHTNEGFKPTFYYNDSTYRETMVRALEEYQQGIIHLVL